MVFPPPKLPPPPPHQPDFIVGFKYYPAGATTNSDFGVTDFLKCYPVFSRLSELNMVLCIHSEVSTPTVDIFDREKVFISTVITKIVSDFPNLKIVMEHISTIHGVNFIKSLPENSKVVGSITPHHIMYNRNTLLVGGVKPHFYCLPILKRETHRAALLEAASSQSGRFIMGTDSAPHTVGSKESSCGCAGVFNGHAAVEMYVEAFESIGRLDALEDFIETGKRFYGIQDGGRTMTLVKEEWKVEESMELGEERVKPLRAGEMVKWKIVR
jgi:dihydroorotase